MKKISLSLVLIILTTELRAMQKDEYEFTEARSNLSAEDYVRKEEEKLQEIKEIMEKHKKEENQKAFNEYTRKHKSDSHSNSSNTLYENFYEKINASYEALTHLKKGHTQFKEAQIALEQANEKQDRLAAIVQEAEQLQVEDIEEFDATLELLAHHHEEAIEKEKEEKHQRYYEERKHFKKCEEEAKEAAQQVWKAWQQLPQLINVKLLEASHDLNNNNVPQTSNNSQLQLYQPLPALPFNEPSSQSMHQLDILQRVASRTHNELAKKVAEQEYESIKAQKDYYDAYNAVKEVKEEYENFLTCLEKEKEQRHSEFLPDDIEPAGTWSKQELIEVSHGTFVDDSYIRRRDLYTPHNIDKQKKDFISFMVVHGSHGYGTPAYFDDTNPKKQNYRHIKRFAAWYAAAHQKFLELTSFRWNGAIDDVKRQAAGQSLANYWSLPHYDTCKRVILTHSHGGNVAFCATHILPPEKAIDLMLVCACPIRREKHNQPLHCKQILYFHSDKDIITKLGRISKRNDLTLIAKSLALPALKIGADFIIGNFAPGFSALLPQSYRQLLENLIGAGVNTSFMHFPVLLRNIADLCMRTNEIPPQNDKIITGYRLTIDGKQPGHSDVTNVVKALPELVILTHRTYFNELTQSSSFDLSVSGYGRDLALGLGVIKPGTTPSPFIVNYLIKTPKKKVKHEKKGFPFTPESHPRRKLTSSCFQEEDFEDKFVPVELYEYDGAELKLVSRHHAN